MTKIILYRRDGACSWVANALLRHLSIPFEAVLMIPGPDSRFFEAADGSFTHEEYRKNVNPDGRVPTLVVDGEIITELPAILTMIAQLAPDRKPGEAVLGKTPLERARVVEWTVWLSGTLQAAGFGGYFRPYRFAGTHEEAYPAVKEKGRRVIESCFERVDARLTGREYAVGDALTIVDINLYVFWAWGVIAGFPMRERFPAYAQLLRRVEALDSVRAAVKDEGMTPIFES
ncbi:glutathione S-transferase [Biscogniauxia marginata]|nr:glutathione S-transferase [Biscogniauxia marginata]